MKSRTMLIILLLAVCLGAARCAHLDEVRGDVVSYGVYSFRLGVAADKPKKSDTKKPRIQVSIARESRRQANTISIDSLKDSHFGIEFIIRGCDQRDISLDFLVEQGSKILAQTTLQLKCGDKRLLVWDGWKSLKAKGLLNQPVYFSITYQGKQLFKLHVTFVE